MNEYRVTRIKPHLDPACAGYRDTSARQGYYIQANSHEEALRLMANRFPNEADIGFDIQLWRKRKS